ncbi:TonB-dependent receptor [Altererythrobacter indicus]|uniref:TonB-dependent receptor n=1 Tax=Altericroceibacterium indicum TaxID=374177 RepID=A0A845AE22_9SPHN|nr:TonB-dependent receptor [Altericroceibacterium indicum]MXP25418.1 TonB-dependent receptor [Altericroceibacterium indicum]
MKHKITFHQAVAACALIAGFAATPLHAETTKDDPKAGKEGDRENTIVVTGYRSSNTATIEAKRNATGITDSIAQDQAGLLPDLTIAQVAQRIPGVALVPDFGTSNDRSPDLAESVLIRGMGSSYNLVTFDGLPLATTSQDSRGARIELLPPSFISRIDVVKTITANLDPHALSGQLDLITASAFDTNETSLITRASIGDNSAAGSNDVKQGKNLRADATFSSPFGQNKDFGIVVSGSFSRFYSSNYDQKPGAVDNSYRLYDRDTNKEISDYNDLSNTNGYSAASRNQIFVYDDKVTRASGIVKLEYNPSEATYASIYTGYFYQKEDEVRNEYLASADTGSAPLDQTATSGTWAKGKTALGYSHQPQKRETFVVSGILDQQMGDNFAAHLRATHSRARLNTIRDRSKFSMNKNTADGAFSYDLSAGYPVLSFDDPDYDNDPANYLEGYIQHITQRAAQNLTFFGGNIDNNFGRNETGLGFNIGASFQTTDQSYDQGRVGGLLLDANGDKRTMEDFVRPTRLKTTDPNVDFLFIDDAAYRDAWIAAGYPNTGDDSDTDISSDYQLNEKVYAAYAESDYKTDNLYIRAGLRFDSTKNKIDLWAQDDNLPAEPNDAAQYVRTHREADYHYLLPSVIASYDFGSGVMLRAGYSKTIGRPNFSYYAISESIGLPEDSDENYISITRGNADLKPRTSNNFDASLEWYPSTGSMFSVAAFYKDMKNLIFMQNITQDNYEYKGELYTARINTPMNSQSASLKGVELSARQDFRDIASGFFSNFVASANATFIQGKQTVVQGDESIRHVDGLEAQPKYLANATLSYENRSFGASIAYNYVGDYLKSINEDSEAFDIFSKGRGEFSAQMRWEALDGVTFILEGQNLTKSEIEYYRKMPTGRLLAERSQKGRVIWLGVNARF